MGNNQDSIELNGKLYDAVTGLPIKTTVVKPTQNAKAPKPIHRVKPAKTIDGFMHAPKHHSYKKVAASTAQPTHKKPVTSTSQHHVKHAVHHKPQKASTLMRHVVKKPRNPISATPAVHDKQHAERLARASSVQKSSLVAHFPSSQRGSVEKKLRPVPVQKAPEHHPTSHEQLHQAHRPVKAHQTHQSPTEKMLAHGLHNAHAHEAAKLVKKPRHRLAHRLGLSKKTTNIMTAALATVLLGGFIVYQNIPNLSVRLASSRAGFQASLPGYQPAGFAMKGPISYSAGKVTIGFASNSDDRNFSLTQQVSNWNSQALVDNFMAVNNKQYQTYQEQGKTIYIYDSSSATWVSGGIWYQVEGNSSLSSEQLLSIANSI